MTLPDTDAEILGTFRKRKLDAELRTPGGVLFPDDLRGVIRTVANIHGVEVSRVERLAQEADE